MCHNHIVQILLIPCGTVVGQALSQGNTGAEPSTENYSMIVPYADQTGEIISV